MNILVITHYYEIDGVSGSIRWTNFIHRLSLKHKIYVLTHSPNIHSGEISIKQQENITIIYIDNENWYYKLRSKAHQSNSNNVINQKLYDNKKVNKKFISLIKDFIRNRLSMYAAKQKAEENFRIVSNFLNKNKIQLDYVISTSRPFVNALSASIFAKKYNIPWHMDEEDLPFSDGASSDSISVFRKEFNKFDKYATNYSIVSYGMRDGLINALKFDSEHAKKIHVIHNGFSQEDKPPMICSHIPNKLDIAYVGDLYAGKRDATMLFKAIRGLIDNGLAQSSDFLIDYAGDSCDSLYENAKPYELQDIIYSHGRIARKDAITMQASADILLLLTWNTKMDRGILTGKLYEYMLIEKPIICITSGEIPQGEATETINELALGFAGEYVSLTEDSLRLEKYLEIQLKRKLNNQKLLFEPNLKGVNEFDYDNLVIKLQKIMGIIN